MLADLRSRIFQAYPLFSELSETRFDSLFANVSLIRLKAGTPVFEENQPCQGFPLLLSGCIRVIKASANGRELQLYRVHAGESCILSSSCLLGHSRYLARGLVDSDVEMIALPAPAFRQLMAEHEAFRNYVFSLFAGRLTDLMELVSAVAFQKLDQRLALLLGGKASPIRITHQGLADELGSAREIVSRLLKGFAEQGWVKLGREHIEISNRPALKKFAEL